MWWEYVIAAIVAAIVIYGFAVLAGFETRVLTRKTDRTAEQMYPDYAGGRKRRWHRDAGQR
jgi:hypothetical protein